MRQTLYRPAGTRPPHDDHELVALIDRLRRRQDRRTPLEALAITLAAIARWRSHERRDPPRRLRLCRVTGAA